MGHRVSIDEALYFTKLSVYLAFSWPPSKLANARENMIYNVSWCISFLSALGLLLPLACALYKHHTDSLFITQTACFMGATSNLMFKMIVYRMHIKRTQSLIFEMEDFLEKAQPHEKRVIQRYVNRCSMFHVFITFINYLTTAMGIAVPLFNPGQSLPTGAIYPFAIDSGIALYLVYIHQAIAGFQCSAGVTIDCQAAVMMWFACARIEILAEELKTLTDVEGFHSFVRKHRKLLSYAAEVSGTMSYIVLASGTACGCAAIMSALQLFSNQPFAVKVQFGPIALIATINLFTCAWPAENLINVCDFLGNSVYNTPWINMELNMMKNLLFLLRRCQRAVLVSISGFLPILSLRSYASFLSAIFSYVTTLRLVLMSNDEK